MEIKKYNYMPKEARAIRQKVFVEEQGFQEEFDEIDGQATHLLVFDGERAVATCRFFFSLKLKGYLVGRIAVLKEYRGKRIGALMMEKTKECLQEIGVNGVFLHAQTHAIGFYEKQGFVSLGIEDEEEGHAHLWMKKEW
jgi:predicted GNAT family N-acyltransferase